MLRSRIIPSLLVHKKGLVKTVNFKDPKYVGDPINAVKIFNEKEVDELIVLDIDATNAIRLPKGNNSARPVQNNADASHSCFGIARRWSEELPVA